ncbi:signal peptidase II [Candidatus Woesearchaeota archaeon]|nr:signal peptidase II [Candidatus Woesearchaeota archaeon]
MKHSRLFFLLTVLILLLDQITKWIVRSSLTMGESIPLLPGVLHFTRIHNTGAAFGLLQHYTTVLIVISFIVLIFFVYAYRDIVGQQSTSIFGALILAGALGNLIDRLFFGYVTDFIDFLIWPAFNIADTALTVGGISVVALYLFTKTLK